MGWGRLGPALVLGPSLYWAASLDAVPAYLIALGLCAAVGSGELYVLLRRQGQRPLLGPGILLAVALAADAALTQWRWFPHLVALATFAVLLWLTLQQAQDHTLADWPLTLAPALYVGALLGYYALLRQRPDGVFWVQLVLLCTWAGDIGAYFVGRRWGRTKLAPAVSPGKSLEGAGGGLLAATGVAIVGALLSIGSGRPWLVVVALGPLVAIAGLLGDLAESWIKRQLGVKDSSRLLRGHGGLLDRMDSLLATGMVAYYYLAIVGG
jgi:phosphatidate cytidylyltransferase